MNSKRVNWLFLLMILFHFVVIFGLSFTGIGNNFSITANLICSELIILIPAVLFFIATKGKNKTHLGFHKMKPSTIGMVIVFTFLTMPLTTVINAISMLFVDNAVMGISGDVLNTPFFIVFGLMALYGPFCEEVVFRGIVYRGYKKSGTKLQAILLSAFLFGLIHMNFNQMPYAFVIGILLAVLIEATGSLWATVLYHVIFNAQTVFLLFLSKNIMPDVLAQEQMMTNDIDTLLYTIGVYSIIAAVTTAGAVCVLVWIARNEKRQEAFCEIWVKHDKKEKVITLPLIIAIIICLSYMVISELIF